MSGETPDARLAVTPVHVVIRDFPETLAVFRRAGVDVPRLGGHAVGSLPIDVGPLLDALAATIRGRQGAASASGADR